MADVFSNPELVQYANMDEALARVRGNKKIYRRMLGMILNAEQFDQLEAALDAQEYEKASEMAHSIKGMTGNLSMPKLFEYSEALMLQLREGPPDPETLAAYREAVVKTRAFVEEICVALDA